MEIFEAIVDERLEEVNIEWQDGACVCLVLASGGYPEHYEKGKEITIGDLDEDVVLCHAGTAMKDGKLVTSGGRVLGVTARSQTLPDALAKAYSATDKIYFEGAHKRTDIGKRALDALK